MTDDKLTIAAQVCPHNESINLCWKCAQKWLPTREMDDGE